MKKYSKGFVLLTTLILIQVLAILVISHQKMFILTLRALNRFEEVELSKAVLIGASRKIISQDIVYSSSCIHDVEHFFYTMNPQNLFKTCKRKINNKVVHYYIEKLLTKHCYISSDDNLLSKVRLTVNDDKLILLRVIFYTPKLSSTCDLSRSFVIKDNLEENWYWA